MTADERSNDWKVVIFVVDGMENHCGLEVPGQGLADCSLRGVRIIDLDHRSAPKGERIAFEIKVTKPDEALAFAREPGTLSPAIIEMERGERGWHLRPEAPGFVRTMRSVRSIDPADMNCVEWLWRVLERGGLDVPDDILTPRELRRWCEAKLEHVSRRCAEVSG
jgi:hypothetical protein